jgi:hypothetical protein
LDKRRRFSNYTFDPASRFSGWTEDAEDHSLLLPLGSEDLILGPDNRAISVLKLGHTWGPGTSALNILYSTSERFKPNTLRDHACSRGVTIPYIAIARGWSISVTPIE